eukprot:TRINITY_DN115464_c0_g1_i1.p1 TRINITY_DN115464_c0_g1~~TRINITY_DN115464_c0_g1_i1.p1  ORF type:complete len:202 (+),score=26.92 TRINITY_DN115464_c0_g1_i1:46-606(+)
MPSYATFVDEDTAWKCDVMNTTLDAYLQMRWPKLEKLWLDANFLSGSIPQGLLDHFPQLVSLDLHDNNLTGSFPAAFARRDFRRLQVHGNHLVGPVPHELWSKLRLRQFNVFMNPGLVGCVPGSTSASNRHGVRTLNELISSGFPEVLPGTNIGRCVDDSSMVSPEVFPEAEPSERQAETKKHVEL